MTEFEKLHASVVSVATTHNCSHSLLTPKNVSVHTLPETTSFSSIAALAGAAAREAYIGTVEKELVFSAHLEPKKDDDADEEVCEVRPSKKRRRCGNTADEEADRVAQARARLAQRAAAVLLLHRAVRLEQRAEVDCGAVRAVGVRAVPAISQLELQPEQPGQG